MAGGPPGLRIVAGEFGGRRLAGPPDGEAEAGARPTAERTREAIFSMLGPVSGRVLDLFCGSGALGLEALSRGAEHATLVDLEITTAAANVAVLGVEDRCALHATDALEYLATSHERYDLVLCDPPYSLADRLGPELDNRIDRCLREGARVVVESAPDLPLELGLELLRERRYGSALVRIYGAGRGGAR